MTDKIRVACRLDLVRYSTDDGECNRYMGGVTRAHRETGGGEKPAVILRTLFACEAPLGHQAIALDARYGILHRLCGPAREGTDTPAVAELAAHAVVQEPVMAGDWRLDKDHRQRLTGCTILRLAPEISGAQIGAGMIERDMIVGVLPQIRFRRLRRHAIVEGIARHVDDLVAKHDDMLVEALQLPAENALLDLQSDWIAEISRLRAVDLVTLQIAVMVAHHHLLLRIPRKGGNPPLVPEIAPLVHRLVESRREHRRGLVIHREILPERPWRKRRRALLIKSAQ